MIAYLRYRYAKTRMAAFVNGELSPDKRRLIARLIDEDSRVYAEYVAHRQMSQELKRQLPVFGKPATNRIDAIWGNIQQELQVTSEPDALSSRHVRSSLGYGFALVLSCLALLIPLFLESGKTKALAMPLVQARPDTVATVTPPAHHIRTTKATSVALLSTPANETDNPNRHLRNTPDPQAMGQ